MPTTTKSEFEYRLFVVSMATTTATLVLMISASFHRQPLARRACVRAASGDARGTCRPSEPTRRYILGASAALAAMPALSLEAHAAEAAEILVEGEVSLGAQAPQLGGQQVVVEVIARRLGKGIVATKRIEQAADKFPSRFVIYAEDLNKGISLEKTRSDDIFVLGTLDVVGAGGSLKRVASVQGKAPIKKGERLKPKLVIE